MIRMRRPVADRLWEKIAQGGKDECWPWQAGLSASGYGKLNVGNVPRLATRLVYELTYGEIPTGMKLDHTCHNRDRSCLGGPCPHRACCNPGHLEPVTQLENVRRSHRHNGAKTHCPQGHEYTEENTYRGQDGSRKCASCRRSQSSAYYWAHKGKRGIG